MVRGLYTSALGMTTQMNKLDIISNNIANVNTAGYKADGVITQSFSEELVKLMDSSEGKVSYKNSQSVGKMSQGLFVDKIYTDFKNGSLKKTDASLDLAISGDGFFTVTDPLRGEDERFTRDGSFTISKDGYLITKDGCYVKGQNGNIRVPEGTIDISENGNIIVNSEIIDTLKMVSFEDNTKLRKQGAGLYSAISEDETIPFKGTVEQGFIETSNVNSVKEMVEMISVSRLYEANQKMITTHDQTLSKAVNELGSR